MFPADIDYGNHVTSTHPGSLFVFARVAALPIKNGTITIFNNTLKKIIVGNEDVIELTEGHAYLNALKTNFGIELDAPYEKLHPLPDDQDHEWLACFRIQSLDQNHAHRWGDTLA